MLSYIMTLKRNPMKGNESESLLGSRHQAIDLSLKTPAYTGVYLFLRCLQVLLYYLGLYVD